MQKLNWNNVTASVFFGILAGVAAVFILLPLIEIIFGKFLHLYLFTTPPSDAWKDDLIVDIAIYLWAMCPSIVAGFVCTLVAQEKELTAVIISIVVIFIAAYLMTKGELFSWEKETIIVQILVAVGYLAGWIFAKHRKRNRDKKIIS
jgi:O-antigen/teichoic acid export membrane protein